MIKPFIRQDTETKIALCRAGSCCPTVEKSETGFILKDDFGGSISLNNEEFALLRDAVNHFKPDNTI